MDKDLVIKNSIFTCITGSHLYGTNIESSDKDFVGIFIPPEEYLIGILNTEIVDMSTKTEIKKDTTDVQYYSLAKFTRLALDNNPNILELLFVNKDQTTLSTPISDELLSLKKHFLSKNVKNRFLGYAFSQRHKMLIKLEHYDLIEKGLDFLEKSDIMYLNELPVNPYFIRVAENTTALKGTDTIINFPTTTSIKKAKSMLEARKRKFGNRTELISKYGYDTKFGMHLTRLLLEGLYLLKYGDLKFPLDEINLLLDIRNGKLSLEEVMELSYKYEGEVEEAVQKTKLPSTPNFKIINKFIIKTHKSKILKEL
uniref:Putative nucleotidyltransferase n=2 Tax=viral metagenome TaxID=1070528 RepID=A0A6H1ZS69_9ZZZZ